MMKNQMNPLTQPSHAVVIGGSIAGLLAARVLTDYFTTVTVIERDRLPDQPAFRKGAPQARHAHGLLVRGLQIMEQFFPGITAELLSNGATKINMGDEAALYLGGKWLRPFHSALDSIGCSRALIEHQLYQRLRADPRVTFRQGEAVVALCTDPGRSHVTGVRLQDRQQSTAEPQTIPATFVVDASGRHSALPQWLAALGYAPPSEVTIDAKAGYASRVYRQPAQAPAWQMMYSLAEAPSQSRGGIIMPVEATNEEGPRWLVTLVGLNGDHPPTDEAGFLRFAQSLPSPEFYAAIAQAEPLSAPYGYQQAANRLRKYDQLPRYLEGVVALGDAVYALNPVYGQGMTVAALGAALLAQTLAKQPARHGRADLRGVAQRFQRGLATVIDGPWQLATGQDLRWPVAAQNHKVSRLAQWIQDYFHAVIQTLADDAVVAEAFFHVQNMLTSPLSLFQPRILWRVWRAGHQPGKGRAPHRQQGPSFQRLQNIS